MKRGWTPISLTSVFVGGTQDFKPGGQTDWEDLRVLLWLIFNGMKKGMNIFVLMEKFSDSRFGKWSSMESFIDSTSKIEMSVRIAR
jgi:hypothetical protein